MGPNIERLPAVHFDRDDREIAKMLHECKETKAIATRMERSVPTINIHIQAMAERVGAANRPELIRWIGQHLECLEPGNSSPSGCVQPHRS